jgi:hypothetical protein
MESKECFHRCVIYYQVGDCVMPREGILVWFLIGGLVQTRDSIAVVRGGM